MTEKTSIEAAKTELESYSEACRAYDALDRRFEHVKFPSITSGSPTVGRRRGYRMEDVLSPEGKPTGKMKRVPALVPCPISVQTQHNPHKEEEAFAEQSYLIYEMRQQSEKCEKIRMSLEVKIGVLREPYRSLLKLKYLEMLKPENIMIDIDGSVKVTDFGLARITDSSKTKTGMVLGTPSYMSPEQLSGKKIDGRSDLFSLGVTLYQMLCGQLPFVGDSMAQLMFKIANETHPDVRSVNPAVPDALVVVIDRALCKDIEQRYQSGDEMARDLCNCLNAGVSAAAGPAVDIEL